MTHHQEPAQLTFEHLVTQLQAAVSGSINGVMMRGSLPVPIGTADQGRVKVVGSGAAGRLVSIELRESTNAGPVLFRLYDGQDTTGNLVATIPLTAYQGTQRSYPGLSFTNGLTIVLTALDGVSPAIGNVEGVVAIGGAE